MNWRIRKKHLDYDLDYYGSYRNRKIRKRKSRWFRKMAWMVTMYYDPKRNANYLKSRRRIGRVKNESGYIHKLMIDARLYRRDRDRHLIKFVK